MIWSTHRLTSVVEMTRSSVISGGRASNAARIGAARQNGFTASLGTPGHKPSSAYQVDETARRGRRG